MRSSPGKRLKKGYARFKSDPAGKRFGNLYRSSQKLKPVVRVAMVALGFVMGLGGLFLGLIPGIPGFVLGAIGFALVAAQFGPVARAADHWEVVMREFWADLRSHFDYIKGSAQIHRTRLKKRSGARKSPSHKIRSRTTAANLRQTS
jgi:hypothetical protein